MRSDEPRSATARRAGLELLHAIDDALRRGRREEREKVAQRLPVHRSIDFRKRKNRLQLRRESDPVLGLGVVKRFDSQAIARQHEALLPDVPDGEGEHAPQVIDAAWAVVLVQMNDGLGVALGAEPMAVSHQLAMQFLVVVDLAVEDDPHGPVFVEHRLLSAFEIDDAEAPHAERDTVLDVNALLVGAAMHHHSTHRTDLVLEDGLVVPADDSSDAAHKIIEVRRFVGSGSGSTTMRDSGLGLVTRTAATLPAIAQKYRIGDGGVDGPIKSTRGDEDGRARPCGVSTQPVSRRRRRDGAQCDAREMSPRQDFRDSHLQKVRDSDDAQHADRGGGEQRDQHGTNQAERGQAPRNQTNTRPRRNTFIANRKRVCAYARRTASTQNTAGRIVSVHAMKIGTLAT